MGRGIHDFVISHYSLYHSSLSDTGAIALARSLQENMSLEGKHPRMSNPKMSNARMSNPKMSNARMSNPKMSNPKMSNAKMSNQVLIRTVP